MEKIMEETLKETNKNIGNNIYKSDRFISETKIIQHFNDKNTGKCIKSVHFSKTTPIKKLQEITFTEENENVIKEIIWYEYNKATNKLIKTTTCDNNNNTITIEDNINNTITTETYHSNGKIKERIIKDKKNNNIISIENFNENGICTSETVYNTEGQKTFKREFYEDGEIVKCLHTYENGKRIKSELFDKKNNKIQEDTYCSFNDTKIQQSTTYDPQTKMITKDVYLDALGQIDRKVQYTYTETATRLDTYNSNGKKTKTEIFDKENNKIGEQILDDDEQVIQITKFYPNKEKDLEIFFDNDGKIEKLKTYHKNKCNREYTFQNIVNFDRDKFLNLSTVERGNQFKQLMETNMKYYAEYDNGKKIREAYFREDGKTVKEIIEYTNGKKDTETIYREDSNTKEKMITYTNGKKDTEAICREDGKTVKKMIRYDENGKKTIKIFFREDGKTKEKKIEYTDGKKIREVYFKEDGKTIEKTIYYENDGEGIKGIGFYNANNEIINMITESELQELLEGLDNNKCDIETLTMSIDEKDSSIKYYSICDKTNKNIRYVITYKGDKKLNTTPIINENNELQTTLSSVQSASGELLDKEKDGLQQPFN